MRVPKLREGASAKCWVLSLLFSQLGHSGTQDVLGAAIGMESTAGLHGGAGWEL